MTHTTFDRWTDLPQDLKQCVVNALNDLKAVASIAPVNHEIDVLSQESSCWRTFLLGNPSVQGPLPQHPRAEAGRIRNEAMSPPPPSPNLPLGLYIAATTQQAHGGGLVEFPDGRFVVYLPPRR